MAGSAARSFWHSLASRRTRWFCSRRTMAAQTTSGSKELIIRIEAGSSRSWRAVGAQHAPVHYTAHDCSRTYQ